MGIGDPEELNGDIDLSLQANAESGDEGGRAETLLEDHRRVRDAAKARGAYEIRALTPVDVIGAWVLLPEVR